MNTQSPHNVRLILTHGISGKADTRMVAVRALQLVIAVGATLASELVGRTLNEQSLRDKLKTAIKQRLLHLRSELDKHQHLAQLGVASARAKTQQLNKSISAVLSGRWVPMDLVEVNVGQLRDALASFADDPTDPGDHGEDTEENGFTIPDMESDA